MGIRLYTHY